MNDKERAAMELALEFLENGNFVYPSNIAIALREALAEQAKQAEIPEWVDVDDYEEQKQEPVAWKETVRALTDQVAALVWERDELQKQVQRYERNGVTCQLYGHKVERSCAECNEDQLYVAPVSAEAIRAEALKDRYFCQRCGKRVGDKNGVWDGVHTCTPPEDVRSA